MAKFPYKGYNKKELEKLERECFALSMGGDFVQNEIYFLFNRREIEKMYNEALVDLIGIVNDGTDKDRKYALDLIGTLVILPFRLH